MITNEVTDFAGIDFAAGQAILIDKKIRNTSFDAVYKVRKAVQVKKVGHAGTLDPYATGLLIICTGKKTKEIYKFQDLPKTYTGIITLGKKTPSMDLETDFIEENPIDDLTPDKIYSARDLLLGKIEQLPPMYSAVKYKGKALYKYARKGKEIEREPREVFIYDFDIEKIELPEVYFKIKCSKGTYIRAIAGTIGEKLSCGAYLSKLRRTAIGEFSVDNAFTIEDFLKILENRKNDNLLLSE